MLSYCTVDFKHSFMNTTSSLQKYQKRSSELKSLILLLCRKASLLENALASADNCSLYIGNKIIQCGSSCMKYFSEDTMTENDSNLTLDELSCPKCKEILFQPITYACGHTYCYSCINDKSMEKCIVCGAAIIFEKLCMYKTNICLSKTLEKWHSNEIASRALCANGLLFMNQGEYHKAVEEFTNALVCVPNSSSLLTHRAEAYMLQSNLANAFKDASRAVELSNKCSKSHFIKAEICYKQCCYEEALLSYLCAYMLDNNKTKAKERIFAIVNKLIASFTRRSNQHESKKFGSKRRLSQDFESPLPVKHHRFHSRAVEERSKNEKISRLLGREYCSVIDLRKPSSFSDKASIGDTNLSCSDTSLGHSSTSFEVEERLDNLLSTYFKNYVFSSELIDVQQRQVDPSLVDPGDFECSLCFRLLHNSVTTPCGHTFCQGCIERSLDHNIQCPMCKQSIEDSLAEQLQHIHANCDRTIESLIKRFLPTQYLDREKLHKDEIREMSSNQPVFVCTIAFPSVPCPLHIFEPRYRLMLRRCLEFNGREFGMCMPENPRPHCQTGTLLKVRNVNYFKDGRSVVDCYGVRRFKTSQCQIVDGYNVAKLNYIVDRPVRDLTATTELSCKVYGLSKAWFDELHPNFKERISQHFGGFPEKDETEINSENGPNWHWWVLSVMPVEDRVKATILGKDLYHERLLIMHRIFQCLQNRRRPK